MTLSLHLVLVLAGGVGAALRYLVDGAVRARTQGSPFPWSTAVVNLTGSLALGLVAGLAADSVHDTEAGVSALTGLLGGYTTFSAASYETVHLVRRRRLGLALAYGVGVLVACVALALAGYSYGATL